MTVNIYYLTVTHTADESLFVDLVKLNYVEMWRTVNSMIVKKKTVDISMNVDDKPREILKGFYSW